MPLVPAERAVPEEVALAYVPFRGQVVPAPSTLVLRRGRDGRLRADSFPETIDVDEALAARRDPRVVRLERGRLYVTAANGQAVYVLVGESPLRLRRRGRPLAHWPDEQAPPAPI